jgi:hypothetical protein
MAALKPREKVVERQSQGAGLTPRPAITKERRRMRWGGKTILIQ